MFDPGAAIRISRQLSRPPRVPRIGRANGGLVPDDPLSPVTGPLLDDGPGRTDTINAHVPSGSYVIPADIVSHMGEGNTLNGLKLLEAMFTSSPRNAPKQPWDASAGPWGSHMPSPVMGRGEHIPNGVAGRLATGGVGADPHGSPTPVAVAGGEFIVHPADVKRLGDGDIKKGHRVLDHFVGKVRADAVKTLKNLPGPVK